MNEHEVQSLLTNMPDLPSLPLTVQQLNAAIADESSTIGQVNAIIEKDQSLTSKLLRLANSSYYGLSSHVDTISRAITILGLNTVRNLALTISVFKIFKHADEDSSIDIEGLWLHSLGCAVSSKTLIRNNNGLDSEKAFICGIIHDIGKIIINLKFPEQQYQILSKLKSNGPGYRLLDAEKEILGITHDHIGAIVGQMWHFPPPIAEAIKYHHSPSLAKSSKLIVTAVHLGNEIAKALALGQSTERYVAKVEGSTWETLQIGESDLPEIISTIQDDFKKAEDFMKM